MKKKIDQFILHSLFICVNKSYFLFWSNYIFIGYLFIYKKNIDMMMTNIYLYKFKMYSKLNLIIKKVSNCDYFKYIKYVYISITL